MVAVGRDVVPADWWNGPGSWRLVDGTISTAPDGHVQRDSDGGAAAFQEPKLIIAPWKQ